MSEKQYYSTIEASKLLGVSVRTVQLWVESGDLDAWKTAGGHRRISAKSVEGYQHRKESIELPANTVKKVLIVEDNPTISKFYQAAINSWGLPITTIIKPNGFEGLVEIGRDKPDVLIADIYMPGLDGLQMIRSLYKSDLLSGENIIVISGLPDEGIAERGGIPSEIQFFNKPVDVAALKKTVLLKLGLS